MKKVLVIGASLNEHRYSNMAIKKLRKYDYEVLAIGLRKGMVKDVIIQTDKINFENIHTITLYINPQRQKEFYDYLLSLKPKRIIFNPGTENLELKTILQQNNIEIVENCTLVMLSSGSF
jgi:hypothetical protein